MTNFNNHREFLGQGLSFPLQINPRGELALVTGVSDIEQAIRIILGTAPGERKMRPEFGCRIHELIFAPNNATTEGLIAHYVEEALIQWEPRIEVLAVNVSTDRNRDGTLLIDIQYSIKDTHDERSIIYPFYLMGEEAPI
ncbi:MAG: GPW/gp25 family protein [Anaerolineaceae bacterium]|nr:GPW/gp25 family protein [Anaerolineaceae bacterium]